MMMAIRILTAFFLWVTCLSAATWAETVHTGFASNIKVSPTQYLGSDHLAQNDQKNSSDDGLSDKVSTPRKDTNKPETLMRKNNGHQETKPVKPFVPSEKIPVDQEVDFPYDI